MHLLLCQIISATGGFEDRPCETAPRRLAHGVELVETGVVRQPHHTGIRHLEKIKIRALLVYGSVFRVAPRVTYNKYAPLGAP